MILLLMKCLHPYYVDAKKTWGITTFRWFPVPCGKCVGCRLARRQEWTFRLSEEVKDSHYVAFATLTYDEQHVPTLETDELSDVLTLNYKDVQLFIKRFKQTLLRKLSLSLRYFCCGEYGSNTLRPHYHCIFFFRGLSQDYVDDICITLPSIFRSCWSLGDILDFQQMKTNGAASYVNKYLHKFYKVELLEEQAVEKSLKSQGIGRGYITRMKNWHLEDPENRTYAYYNGYKIPLPRYFREKIFGIKKEKKPDYLIENIYDQLYDKELTKILAFENQYLSTYGSLTNCPKQLPLQPSSLEEIEYYNNYLKHIQTKDKF